MSSKREGIVVVGGVPLPIGGVTTFTLRMLQRYPKKVHALVDLYRGSSKNEVPVRQILWGRLKYFSLFFEVIRFANHSFYFNFSSSHALLIFSFLPKIKKTKWALTLHNGDLEKTWPLRGFWGNFFFKASMRRIDYIGCLSNRQKEFYLSKGAPEDKIVKIDSYIPVEVGDWINFQYKEIPIIEQWVGAGLRYFVISGYPTSIYRHLEVLDSFSRLYDGGMKDVRLVAFIYGDDSEGLLKEMVDRFGSAPFSLLVQNQDSSTFLSCLKFSSGYIRMNVVDSFGVAVAEAINLNVPTLATDVCDRYPGAVLVKPDDYTSLENFIYCPPEMNNNIYRDNRDPSIHQLLRLL